MFLILDFSIELLTTPPFFLQATTQIPKLFKLQVKA
jgi:hypothetical protein